MKKLASVLERRGVTIATNDTEVRGRFTIVTLTDSRGHQAIGMSRRSDEDTDDPEVGIQRARGRAERSLYALLRHKKMNHPLMG